jgi:hypothetical protein
MLKFQHTGDCQTELLGQIPPTADSLAEPLGQIPPTADSLAELLEQIPPTGQLMVQSAQAVMIPNGAWITSAHSWPGAPGYDTAPEVEDGDEGLINEPLGFA